MHGMTTRQRFQAVMNFQPFDRLPVLEWAGWWDRTIQRWHAEGLAAELTDRYDICRHFGLDIYLQQWFGVCSPGCPRPARHGAGILTSMDEYEKIREYLYPWPVVNRGQWTEWAARQARGEVALWFTVDGFFWFPRRMLGIERHLYAFYDQGELMHRINADLADWIVRIIDEVCSICTPDFMTFGEDMSYNHGPMLSEAMFDEFCAPYYRQVVPVIEEIGSMLIVDSDGDVTEMVPWMKRVGARGVLPLERQAGVDGMAIREAHPDFIMVGHYDKMVMNRGEEAIRGEFERLLPLMRTGRFIPSVDHQTPPGVSFEQYHVYLRLFAEYAEMGAGR